MINSSPIREVFTRDEFSLYVTFPTHAQLRAINRDNDDDGELIRDRDRFIIELVRRIDRHNEMSGADVVSVDRVLTSSDQSVEVSYDSFDFIVDLTTWLLQYTYVGTVRVERNFPLGVR